MNKIIYVIIGLSLLSCLNQKNEISDESLQFYSSEGNFLGRHIEEWGSNKLISGVMNESSPSSSINFLEPRTWSNGNGYFSILNNDGEQNSTYIDEREGIVYAHTIHDQENVFAVGVYENKFLFSKFEKNNSNWKSVVEKQWLVEGYTSGVIDLIQKTDENFFVQGRVILPEGKSKIYFATIDQEGNVFNERIHERLTSYFLPKSVDFINNKVKIFIWEQSERNTRIEISEYTINPKTNFVENVEYGSDDQHYVIDAVRTSFGLVMIERNEGEKDLLHLKKKGGQWIEIPLNTEKKKLRDIIGKNNYFIVSATDENSSELEYHALNINSLGDVLSDRIFNNTTSSYILDIEYLGDDKYFTMTSSLLKYKYVLEFRKQ